ncbi:MAG TPA: ComF family protein [Burkholderiales bacterium]|nr:ComF family protein [Burkholderiales bacterium]
MSNSITRAFDDCLSAVRWLAGAECLLCRAAGAREGLCAPCGQDMPRLSHARCRRCALPLAAGDTCGRCLAAPPRYDRVVAGLRYEFPATALVQGLKYGGKLACARPLALQLAQALEDEPYPDLVMPMPLTKARLAERGFNQSMEIARIVAREFGLRVSPDLCRRVRQTAPQAALPWKERARNVRRAFACDTDLSGLRIAVVDDVLTTGATLDELSATLKRRGAVQVTGWIATRTPAPGGG